MYTITLMDSPTAISANGVTFFQENRTCLLPGAEETKLNCIMIGPALWILRLHIILTSFEWGLRFSTCKKEKKSNIFMDQRCRQALLSQSEIKQQESPAPDHL